MTPIRFLGFRDELNPASGFQSKQFREIEVSSGLKDKKMVREFAHDDFARKRLEARMNAPSLSEAFFALLRRRGFDTPATDAPRDAKERRSNYGKRQRAMVEVLTHQEQLYKEYQLAEALLEHDEYFSLWRSHHIKMVERMVGAKPGTGGSEGVGYLRTTLDKKFFPELWEARTYLSTKHGDEGCPFAKT
jgi:tryptophan 2,3-dioxygenase